MKFLFLILVAATSQAYRAEIRELNSKDKDILFNLVVEEKIEGDQKIMNALFKSNEKIAVEESASMSKDSAELIHLHIQQFQTKEKGSVEVVGDKVKLTYQIDGKPIEKKEFKKPSRLVSPGNFDDWVRVHFEEIQKNKSIVIDFLVWDKLETYKMKLTYLGLVDLNSKKVHQFKLNIDSVFISAFISPIKIWMSEDLKNTLRYEGAVAVKQVKGPGPKNFDAEVVYFHDVKAAQ